MRCALVSAPGPRSLQTAKTAHRCSREPADSNRQKSRYTRRSPVPIRKRVLDEPDSAFRSKAGGEELLDHIAVVARIPLLSHIGGASLRLER